LQLEFMVGVFEFVLIIFSLSFHECAHAWMASRLGDQTARMQGRITLNPMYHMDPIGTLIFPAIAIFGPMIGFGMFGGLLIGWAKPTPVITRNFKKIVRDDNLTTLAGPFSNALIVIAALVVLTVISLVAPGGHEMVLDTFFEGTLNMDAPGAVQALQGLVLIAILAIEVNLSLFVFNLIPIPPLDGSHLVRNTLPYNAVQVYDRIPMWVSYLLMIFLGRFIMGLFLTPLHALFGLGLRLV
jgi:Zn-dependent protease